MPENPIRPKGRIDACKSYMAQGTYRCMKILYGPRVVYSLYVPWAILKTHGNPVLHKGRIDVHENPVLS